MCFMGRIPLENLFPAREVWITCNIFKTWISSCDVFFNYHFFKLKPSHNALHVFANSYIYSYIYYISISYTHYLRNKYNKVFTKITMYSTSAGIMWKHTNSRGDSHAKKDGIINAPVGLRRCNSSVAHFRQGSFKCLDVFRSQILD